MIEKLVAMLEQKVKDLTSEEIADILWLTFQQWQSDSPQEVNELSVSVESSLEGSQVDTLLSDSTLPIPLPSGEVVSPSGLKKPETAGITTQTPQNKSQTQNSSDLGAPLAIPDSPSLRRSLDILRAIRPLIRLVPSAEATYLDVPATVKAIAETEIWALKLRTVLEPWLELALVVDATPSMVIWQRTILNLRRVLAQSGVFRDVRLWSLEALDCIEDIPDSSEQKITQRLCIRSGFGTATASQPPCRPQELLDPNGRRLILVVSDCIDPRWDAQPIRNLLQVWANRGAIGLVQVLPEWLWSRTGLSQVTKGQMVGTRPGQPSQSLTFVRRKRPLRSQPDGVKVPVMTLEPDVTNRWSQMVAGKSSISSPGLVFSSVSVQELSFDTEFDSQESEEPTPQERLAQFRAYSSPIARQLAGLLAACPEVNLPVVRMVQAALLPESQQVHVAEVLLGGLFKSQTDITAYTPADRVQYVFHDGVKPLVQETISPKKAFNALSAWVMRRFGYALEDFRAYLTDAQSEEIQPFAGLMLDVLNRQSSQNVELIERIKELSDVGKTDEVDKSNEGVNQSDFPELEVLSFTTAQLVEAESETWYPPLQTEEYMVATIALETVPEYKEALRAAQAIQDESSRTEALIALAANFPEAYRETLSAVLAIQDEYCRTEALIALASNLPADLYGETLSAVLAIQDEYCRAQGLIALAANFPEAYREALSAVLAIQDEYSRTEALIALAPNLPADLYQEVLSATQAIADESYRSKALIALAPNLPADLYREVLSAVLAIQDEYSRTQALIALAPNLPADLYGETLSAVLAIQDESYRSKALIALAANLPEELYPEALNAVLAIQDESYRARVLSALVENLPQKLYPEALNAAQAIADESYRSRALIALAANLPPELYREVLSATQAIADESYRSRALIALVANLPQELYPEALNAVQDIAYKYYGVETLIALAANFPEAYREALSVAQAIQDESSRSKALIALAANLPEELYKETLRAAQAIQDEYYRAQVLSALAANFPQELTDRTVILEPFNFKVGYLVKSGDRWVVQKSEGQAYRYVEQIDENVALEMVGIAGGEFTMGSPDEELERYDNEGPQHLVTVPDFYMGRYPVTQAQWRVVAAMSQVERELAPDPSNSKGDDRPVECVSWEDAIEFCVRLSNYTNRQYRLPTESEWEYACRAGTTTPFHFGETISIELANYNGNYTYANGVKGESPEETTPVENFDLANVCGLSDMHGNVREWCEDYWHDDYRGAPEDGSAWLTDNPEPPRVNRGGSYFTYPRDCRSACRFNYFPDEHFNNLGFRVSCSAPETFPAFIEEL